MIKFFKIALLITVLFSVSCKSKKDATLSVYGESEDLNFRKKFHDANNEKMIGHFEKSIKLFNECIVLKPEASASYFGLSKIYLEQKDMAKSIDNGQKAYDLNTNNKWYTLHLAELYHSIGNYHKSAKYYGLLFSQFDEKNIDYRYQLVESLIYSEQTQKAINQMNLIEVETGKSPQLSLTKHDLYNKLGKSKEANQEITSLLNEYPSDVEVRAQILDYYLQTNQVTTAETIAKQMLAVDSNNSDALLGLADIEIRKNNIDASFDYLEQGFKTGNVESERKLQLLNGLVQFAFDKRDGNSDKINDRLVPLFKITEQDENNNADFLSLYGAYLQLNNNKLEARTKFKKSCDLNPSDYKSWDGLLNSDYENNMFDSLFVDGQKAIEYFPTQPMVYLLTGIGAYESNHFDEAEEYLILGKDFVIKDDEFKAEFEYQLGKSYWKSGKQTQGQALIEKAITTSSVKAKMYNGYALLLLDDNKIDDALKQSYLATQNDSKNQNCLNVYGTILIKKKSYTDAVEILHKAVVIDFENGEVLENYGDALFLNNEKDKALDIWKEAKKQGNTSELLLKKIKNIMYYEN